MILLPIPPEPLEVRYTCSQEGAHRISPPPDADPLPVEFVSIHRTQTNSTTRTRRLCLSAIDLMKHAILQALFLGIPCEMS
jgi:hypothetical protein